MVKAAQTHDDSMPALIAGLPAPARPQAIKERLLAAPRRVSLAQARIITDSYRSSSGQPRAIQRALAFAAVCRDIALGLDPDELIVGNRTPEPRAGVVFPEASVAWLERELDSLPRRPQDPFEVDDDTRRGFLEEILPAWRGRTLEDEVYSRFDAQIKGASRVVKINQRDHAQGHIIPDLRAWLAMGPAGLEHRLREATLARGDSAQYQGMLLALDGARTFIARHARLAAQACRSDVAVVCSRLVDHPPTTFHEALQSTWFLYVLLHLESNASSFSLGRLDRVLWPYLERDLSAGRSDLGTALELIECFFCKCNQIVYMRNGESARYFAGFPIGFNVCIGGIDEQGRDVTNPLSWLLLRAQADLLLPQPNLSLRVHANSPVELLAEATRVIGLGSGMPQVFNDESIVPALEARGIAREHARDYAVVGCVELATQGNMLGWSDAAMVNLVKCLELALNDSVCLVDGKRLGPAAGSLSDHADFAAVERALAAQIDHALAITRRACDIVERTHAEVMPSPFLSCVIDDCIGSGRDVTAGGARYNLAGIQAIQVANLADSLAVLRQAVFQDKAITGRELLDALRGNWEGQDALRERCLNSVPKFGNDVAWVDDLGAKWAEYFADQLDTWRNTRGGPCHMGLYTVSAHVPMGRNVGATPDGRHAGDPLADGGVSPMYGRDRRGPTAVLRSVARLPFRRASNGTLLNMKFLPQFFHEPEGKAAFVSLLRGWCRLGIHHAQFNVLCAEDLRAAQKHPERWRSLTVRVAGYTAYFVELAPELQEEIIARTAFGEPGGTPCKG